MKFSSVLKALSHLWHSKKIWLKPPKAKVLIFDRDGSEVFLTYLDSRSVAILDIRGESINIYVLFKCLLQRKFSLLYYCIQYLKCVNPNVAVTFIDNNPLFYQLKSHKKDLTTIFVQNGIRAETGCVLGILKEQIHSCYKYQVDYMLTFGTAIGGKYSKLIDGKTLPIGSFKNNFYQSKTHKTSKSVIFISQYKLPPCPESKPMLILGNQPILWKQFYYAEEFLLPLLQKYCLQNKLELKICMIRDDETSAKGELNYFRTLLGNENLEVQKKTNPYTSYEEVDAAEFVVFIDSTLGYEALALGKKTAVFSLRGKSMGVADRNFGWPADLPESGPFWTSQADKGEFTRVMDYITTVSDEEWMQTSRHYVADVMEYDPGNSRFLKLMRELGVPLKPEYQSSV